MRHRLFLAVSVRRIAAFAFGAALVIPASSVVQAQATAPAAENGLLTLPNVRVIKPDASRSRPVAFVADGVKAFIDGQSGTLVEPSFEALADLARAPGNRKPEPKASRGTAYVLPNGTHVLRASPSMINLSIARIGDGGSVALACTPDDTPLQVFRVVVKAEVEQ
jgi:hypothetical protein